MHERVVVSVPGKLILMGEHAAVYGRPAVVAAVEPRLSVEIRIARRGVRLELRDFDHILETSWSEIREHTEGCREAWRRYVEQPTPERFANLRSASPSSLVLVALGEVAASLAPVDLPAVAVRIESGLPVGSGFGSSASTAVAVITALLTLLQGSAQSETIDRLAFEVERRQHGLPSGVDHKTVLTGGVVWAARDESRGLEISRLETRSADLDRLQVFQTGQPEQTTGAVVAAVRRRREQDRAGFDALLDRMQSDVEQFRDRLLGNGDRAAEVSAVIRDYERCLEELGVVPEPVRRALRRVERAGGAAKISGAGALSGVAAGCLLVHWPGEAPEAEDVGLGAYRPQPVELGAPGLCLELVQ